MNKLLKLFFKLIGRHTTASSVMSDFEKKAKQLQGVVAYQKKQAGKEAEKIAKAISKQDQAQTEAFHADQTIEALKSLTKKSSQSTLADLKKELK